MKLPMILAPLLLLPAVAQAEQVVILSSNVPGFKNGTVINDGQPVTLPPNSSATVLFQSGQTLTLYGPFNGPVPAVERRTDNKTLYLYGQDTSAVGASRGVTISIDPPSSRR